MKKGLALLTLFLFALPASAQPVPLVEDVPVQVQPVKPPEPTPYEKGMADAKATKKPLIIFVGVPIRQVEGAIVIGEKTLDGVTSQVVLYRNGGTGDWYDPRVTTEQLRKDAGLEREPAASFFALPKSGQFKAEIADDSKDAGSLPAWPKILDGMTEYKPTRFTQSIYNQGEETDKVSRFVTAAKWHQSGGMLGIHGFNSRLYKLVPDGGKDYLSKIWVKHSFGPTGQYEVGLNRDYPNGTRFIDRLSNEDGKDFEARLRFKKDGKWQSKVIFSDHAARPQGYAGLSQSCASCHDEAGTGIYGAGLVPGGDTVISDELNWALLSGLTQQQRRNVRNGS